MEPNRSLIKLKEICPLAYDKDNNLLSIREQFLLQQEASTFIKDYKFCPYLIIDDSSKLKIPELKGRPIIITNASLKHIGFRHGMKNNYRMGLQQLIDKLNNIKEEIENNVLVYQDPINTNHFCFVLNSLSENNNQLITVIDIRQEIDALKINKIITIHGKEFLFEQLQKTLDLNLKIYTNNRTGNWLIRNTSDNCPVEDVSSRLLNLYYKQNNINIQDSF